MTDVLVATDLSENSIRAVEFAFDMASLEGEDIHIDLLWVSEPRYPQAADLVSDMSSSGNRERAEEHIAEWLGDLFEDVPEYDLRIETGEPAEKIRDSAEELGSDFVVVAKSGRGAFQQFIAGSTALALADHPPVDLAICHPDGDLYSEIEAIAVGVDFSAHSRRAIERAAHLAESIDAELHLVHVVLPPPRSILLQNAIARSYGEMKRAIEEETVPLRREQLSEEIAELERSLEGIDVTTDVLFGEPKEELLEYADGEEIGAVLVGAKGRTGLEGVFTSSVAHGVAKHSPTHTVVIPPVRED